MICWFLGSLELGCQIIQRECLFPTHYVSRRGCLGILILGLPTYPLKGLRSRRAGLGWLVPLAEGRAKVWNSPGHHLLWGIEGLGD